MSSTKVAVVIPTYKEELDELEKISLAQARKILVNYPFVMVAPEGKNFSYFAPSDMVVQFPPQFFQSVKTYNQLMMSPKFYEAFTDFDYILIYQLDAFVFHDALEYFCSLGYDYIGAPWPRVYREPWIKITSNVGNGGFCLRNVKAHYNILKERTDLTIQWNARQWPEDNFFSHCGKRTDCNFRVAPIDVAYKFSAEFNPPRVIKKNGGKLPFGCHDWRRKDTKFYSKLFQQFGYDFPPIKNTMPDSYADLANWLSRVAFKRLVRRVNRGQSLIRYLPKNHFASIRVVRSPLAMIIFARLLLENPQLADEIFLYEESEQDILIDDLILKREPHLLINLERSGPALNAAIEKKGLAYGKRFVSFQREYLTCCEKLFRSLGK